ncbi:MAG: ADP-ribosylation factor-like protein [Candidatus Heimdallarchaeaceae archaeon]
MSSKNYLRFRKKGVPIAVLGLPRAGKTTFVNRVVTGQFSEPTPTMGVNFERISAQDARFDIFDLGGHKIYRETIWENYIRLSYGIIFIIDSSNKETIAESKKEFWRSVELKKSDEEFLILFLCNKSDLDDSMYLETMVKELDLYKLAEIPNATYQIFKVSMKTGENFEQIMFWLQNKTNKLIHKRDVSPVMFLIGHKDGLPIISIDKKEIKKDAFLISGFLSAVQNFSTEILGNEGVMQFIMSEGHKYIISATDDHIYALLIGINESQEEARRIIDIIKEFHQNAQDLVELEKFILNAFKLDMTQYDILRTFDQ